MWAASSSGRGRSGERRAGPSGDGRNAVEPVIIDVEELTSGLLNNSGKRHSVSDNVEVQQTPLRVQKVCHPIDHEDWMVSGRAIMQTMNDYNKMILPKTLVDATKNIVRQFLSQGWHTLTEEEAQMLAENVNLLAELEISPSEFREKPVTYFCDIPSDVQRGRNQKNELAQQKKLKEQQEGILSEVQTRGHLCAQRKAELLAEIEMLSHRITRRNEEGRSLTAKLRSNTHPILNDPSFIARQEMLKKIDAMLEAINQDKDGMILDD